MAGVVIGQVIQHRTRRHQATIHTDDRRIGQVIQRTRSYHTTFEVAMADD